VKSSETVGKPLIKDSLGELSNLMIQSTDFNEENLHVHKRGSVISLSGNQLIQFKPPTNLKPIENGETIQLDIETYRSLLQDIQNTKIILYKLANILREPHLVNTVLNENGDLHESDDVNNSLISSFYNHVIGNNKNVHSVFNCNQFAFKVSGGNHSSDKVDQSTQTE
jgi:hypothetical protein